MNFTTDKNKISSYLEDASNLNIGKAETLYFPSSSLEISNLLKDLNKTKTPLTVSGAGTGVVGSRIPLKGVILSTERLNKIIELDNIKKKIRVEAGLIVNNLLEEIKKYNLFYPPFPTEKSATIGGNAATNASGEYSFKYTSTRKFIKGLKVVLSNGDILNLSREQNKISEIYPVLAKINQLSQKEINRKISNFFENYHYPINLKNTAGYFFKENMDLLDLFIGSEGTLGIITEIELDLIEQIKNELFILVFLNKNTDIFTLYKEILESKIKKNILIFEYFDQNSLKLLSKRYPIAKKSDFAFLLAFQNYDLSLLENLKDILKKHQMLEDYTAFTENDIERIYQIRHRLPEEINRKIKANKMPKISTDIAVPSGSAHEMFTYYKSILKKTKIEHFLFGHFGESHLHVNLLPKNKKQLQLANELYVELLKKGVCLGGTISAEHGVGKKKKKYLPIMYDEQHINIMKSLKSLFDPNSILSPGNLF